MFSHLPNTMDIFLTFISPDLSEACDTIDNFLCLKLLYPLDLQDVWLFFLSEDEEHFSASSSLSTKACVFPWVSSVFVSSNVSLSLEYLICNEVLIITYMKFSSVYGIARGS